MLSSIRARVERRRWKRPFPARWFWRPSADTAGSTNSVLIPNSVTRSHVSAMSRVLGSSPGSLAITPATCAIRVGEIGKRLVERDDLRACERRKLLSQFGVERRQPRDVAGILLIGLRVWSASASPAAIFCT